MTGCASRRCSIGWNRSSSHHRRERIDKWLGLTAAKAITGGKNIGRGKRLPPVLGTSTVTRIGVG
jgi:hypothetical protein